MKGGSKARKALLRSAGLAALLGGATIAWAQSGDPEFAAQVLEGRTAYAQHCASCHGDNLEGGQFAGALKGAEFLSKWGADAGTAADLFRYIHTSMPPGAAGTLPDETYAAILALIMAENDAAGAGRLAANEETLATLSLPPAEVGVGGLSQRYPLPPGPEILDRFANYTPVTQEMLSNPAPENWLTWRRSHQGLGYSPLRQIHTGNIDELRVAWAQALPPGANMNEPLVRDGVLYVFGYGDSVHAFDAASGRSLWTYKRQLPARTTLTSKKTLALWGSRCGASPSPTTPARFATLSRARTTTRCSPTPRSRSFRARASSSGTSST